MEYAVPVSGVALQPAAAPASTLTAGPEEGYVWSVKILSATLGSAGTLAVYKASAAGQTSRLVGFNSASQTLQPMFWAANQCRSEEHTSELQSHLNLVCRLLLEKKKKDKQKPLTRRHPSAASLHRSPA